jgi:hypothetical protein
MPEFRTPSHPDNHGITKLDDLDQATGSVDDWTGVNGLVGYSFFRFFFFNQGGTDNLLPGRPTTQTVPFMSPPNSGGPLICVSMVNGRFVTDGGAKITQRPLGQFIWNVWVAAAGVLACEIKLSDENLDDPIKVELAGTLLFYGHGE